VAQQPQFWSCVQAMASAQHEVLVHERQAVSPEAGGQVAPELDVLEVLVAVEELCVPVVLVVPVVEAAVVCPPMPAAVVPPRPVPAPPMPAAPPLPEVVPLLPNVTEPPPHPTASAAPPSARELKMNPSVCLCM
jgi:hypothetical protein